MVIDMKLSVGKRILMFFHWLLSLLFVATFAVYLIAPGFLKVYYHRLVDVLGYTKVRIIGIALLAVYAIIAVAQACLVFKRKKRSDRGFITVDSSDSGKVRIAISAIEQMVRQSVGSIDGLTDMKINIENQDDAIGIIVTASIVNGSHVPTITMNMQRAIRQFVETNCGVAVRTVSISINSVTNQQDAPKRRRRGKGQEPALPQTNAVTPVSDYAVPDDTDYDAPAVTNYDTPAVTNYDAPAATNYEAPAPAPEPVAVETPVFAAPAQAAAPAAVPEQAYDFDKPYESEFAKDLAAMKARDAAESGTGEAGEEPLDEYAE